MNQLHKSSLVWWEVLLADPAKQIEWLKKQYHGEVLAGRRIRRIFGKFKLDAIDQAIVDRVASEEDQHALWLGNLLEDRGVNPEMLTEHEERYWDTDKLDEIASVEEAAAIGFHAEVMRLARIKTIRDHPDSPEDMSAVMARIFEDEVGHVAAFKGLTNPDAIEAAREDHDTGVNALGLVA